MRQWYDGLKNKYPSNWEEVSKACKLRDKKKCRICGAKSTPENKLHACHIDPKKPAVLSNLITKCEDCHTKEPKHQHLKTLRNNRLSKSQKKSIQIKPFRVE